jgi:integration host factor subunit alpha
MTTLTKADIARAISQKTDHTVAQSANLVDTLFDIIKETLESGEDVLISGFGKWSVRAKRERRGRNPQTGEDMMLAPRKVVKFKCPSVLKDKLNRKRSK